MDQMGKQKIISKNYVYLFTASRSLYGAWTANSIKVSSIAFEQTGTRLAEFDGVLDSKELQFMRLKLKI